MWIEKLLLMGRYLLEIQKEGMSKELDINLLSCLVFLIEGPWAGWILNYPGKINAKWVKLSSNNNASLKNCLNTTLVMKASN